VRALLTIAIPTYNRAYDLARLHSEFLKPAIDAFPDLLDIVVCDNSDEDEANRNAAMLDPRVRHLVNTHNLGFAGNLLRCLAETKGEFVWIISDNDSVDMTVFCRLIAQLPQTAEDGVRGVMLPFRTISELGRPGISGTHEDWAVGRETTPREMMATAGKLPFILFSTVVIRADAAGQTELAAEVGRTFEDNHFLQVPLFLALLGEEARMRFFEVPLQTYHAERVGRWDMEELANSLESAIEYAGEHGGNRRLLSNRYYRGWLILSLHHLYGPCLVLGADKYRAKLLAGLRKHPNPKDLVLCLALMLPAGLAKWPYLMWQALLENRSGGAAGLGTIGTAREIDRQVTALRQDLGR